MLWGLGRAHGLASWLRHTAAVKKNQIKLIKLRETCELYQKREVTNGHTSGLLICHARCGRHPPLKAAGSQRLPGGRPRDIGGCVSSRRMYVEVGRQRPTAHRGFCPRELLVNRTNASWLRLLSGIYFAKYENSSSKRILSTQSSWITVDSSRGSAENVSPRLLRWT